MKIAAMITNAANTCAGTLKVGCGCASFMRGAHSNTLRAANANLNAAASRAHVIARTAAAGCCRHLHSRPITASHFSTPMIGSANRNAFSCSGVPAALKQL